MYGMLSGIGTFLYKGKSVISSGEASFLIAGGFSISGGGIKGSLICAQPSTKTVDNCLYLAAFLRMCAIINYILSALHAIPPHLYNNLMLSRLTSLVKPAFRFSGGYVSHRDTPDNNDSVPFEYTAETMTMVNEVMGRYPDNHKGKRSAMIPLLMLAQKQNDNFLSLNAMKKVAKILEVNDMDVYQVATFYTMFNRTRVGKFHLQVCGTTPCQLRGSEKIIEACEKHLRIKEGQTTPDGMYTIQEVECLGACANAPMIQVNGEWVYEDLTPQNTVQLLKDLKAGTAKKGSQIGRNDAEGPEGRTTLTDKGGQNLPTHSRDFAKAKQDWQDAQKKRIEEEKKKAQEAKRVEEEKRAQAAKKI